MDNRELISSYYIAHRDELLAFVSSRLGSDFLAEDMVHDVFMRLLRSDKLLTEVSLPCLVYTVCRNMISDYYRRHTCHEQYEHFLKRGTAANSASSAESLASVRDLTEQLERSLARLPEHCREVYRLHVYGGMKTAEISRCLGDSYKSVEYRLGLARKEVRQRLRRVV